MNAIKVTLMSVLLAFSVPTFSQSGRGGGPPPWAPAHGYRAKTQHVYFPSLNIYFDVHRNSYYFLSGDRWIISHRLPPAIPLPLLRAAPKVELSIITPTPYRFNEQHRVKYKAPNSLPRPKGQVIYPPHPGNKGNASPKPGNSGSKGKAEPKPGNSGSKGNVGPKPGKSEPKGNVGPKPGNSKPKGNSGSKSGGGKGKGGGKK